MISIGEYRQIVSELLDELPKEFYMIRHWRNKYYISGF